MADTWRERAACLPLPDENAEDKAELFFSLHREDMREAKRICGTCPVRRECLLDALEHQDRFGVFGGADHYERRRALQINGEGYATNDVKPIRCPLCLNKRILTIVKRRAWMKVSCTECDLTWVAKRVVPRKKTTTQETSTGDSGGKAVEPAVPTDS